MANLTRKMSCCPGFIAFGFKFIVQCNQLEWLGKIQQILKAKFSNLMMHLLLLNFNFITVEKVNRPDLKDNLRQYHSFAIDVQTKRDAITSYCLLN